MLGYRFHTNWLDLLRMCSNKCIPLAIVAKTKENSFSHKIIFFSHHVSVIVHTFYDIIKMA